MAQNSRRAMTLFTASCIARELHGTVWYVDVRDFGVMLRAQIGNRFFRLVKMRAGVSPTLIPAETSSTLTVLTTAEDLRSFLAGFEDSDDLPFGPSPHSLN